MADFKDKDLERFYNKINPSGESDFSKTRSFITRNLRPEDLKGYSPSQLINSARTVEELVAIGKILKERERGGGAVDWWHQYRMRKIELGQLPSLHGIDPVTGKTKWGVPVTPEVYTEFGREKVNRRLFTRPASWEQVTGKQKLFETVTSPSGPSIKNWKAISAPSIVSNNRTNALIFDFETTGLLEGKNANLISVGMMDTKTKQHMVEYAKFDKGLKYPEAIRNKIIPQWESAVFRTGAELKTERQLLESFIQKIEETHSTHALMGYNIRGFDIPKAYEVAKKYGLQKRLESVLSKTEIVDVSDYVKAFISKKVGGNILGWEASELGASPLGWQLEVVAETLGVKPVGAVGAAHEAGYDVKMTQKVWELLKDPSKWDEIDFDTEKFIANVAKSRGISPARIVEGIGEVNYASKMLASEEKYIRDLPKHLAERYPKTTAKIAARKEAITKVSEAVAKKQLPSATKFATGARLIGGTSALPLGIAAAGLGLGALAVSSIANNISSPEALRPTSYQDIPEEEYVNKFAKTNITPPNADSLRTQGNSDFVPMSLMGVPLSPEVYDFRRNILNDRERFKELEKELAEKELASSDLIGSLTPQDLIPGGQKLQYSGLNTEKTGLREVDLSKFKVEVEDADTVILKRKVGNFLGQEKPVVIRLAGIDAPEVAGHALPDPLEEVRVRQNQLYGKEASDKLRRLVQRQESLRLVVDMQNRTYGRSIGVLYGDAGVNLNVEAARQGLASALPFGQESEDILKRDVVKQAEQEAFRQEKGMWQYARYKAVREASEIIGGPITYNTFTSLIKLSKNLNVGAYESFLNQMGDREGALSEYEIYKARQIGRSLKKTHDPKKFVKSKHDEAKRKFNGGINSIGGDGYLQTEGLRHGGMAPLMRRSLTEFGSGWKGALKESGLQAAAQKIGGEVLGTKQSRAAAGRYAVGFARTVGSDDFLQGEGLGHSGIAQYMRHSLTDFGSGSRIAINFLKGITTFTESVAKKQKFFGKVKGFFTKSKYTKNVVKEIEENISKNYNVFDDYESFYREQIKDLPSLANLPKEQVEKNLDFLVESKMSGLKQQAKKTFGSEEEYRKLLGPTSNIKTKSIFRGTEEHYKYYDPKISPKVSEATSLIHEALEIEHGQRAIQAGLDLSKIKFGSHVSYGVIKDEALISEALGGEFSKSFRSTRTREGVLVQAPSIFLNPTSKKDFIALHRKTLQETREIQRSTERPSLKFDSSSEGDVSLADSLRESSFVTKERIRAKKLAIAADARYQARVGLAYTTAKEEKKSFLKRIDGIHPGVDDSISADKIREHTDFGSGWDSARTIAKAISGGSTGKKVASSLVKPSELQSVLTSTSCKKAINEVTRYNAHSANVSLVQKASKEAKTLFENSSMNMDIATATKIRKAANATTRATSATAADNIKNVHKTSQTLQDTIKTQIDTTQEMNNKVLARKKKFYELSKQSVGAGARSGHNAARRHSSFSSTSSTKV